MTRQELMNQADMLQGNINRMMVTKDFEELSSMYQWVERRLQIIYRERVKELGDAYLKGGGYRYGKTGKTYYGKGAKAKVEKQGRAIKASQNRRKK